MKTIGYFLLVICCLHGSYISAQDPVRGDWITISLDMSESIGDSATAKQFGIDARTKLESKLTQFSL